MSSVPQSNKERSILITWSWHSGPGVIDGLKQCICSNTTTAAGAIIRLRVIYLAGTNETQIGVHDNGLADPSSCPSHTQHEGYTDS